MSLVIDVTNSLSIMPIQLDLENKKENPFDLRESNVKKRLIVFGIVGFLLISFVAFSDTNSSIELTDVKGEVYIQASNGEYEKVQDGYEVKNDGFLKTGKGSAKVIYPNKAIDKIGSNSEIYLDTNEGNRSILSTIVNSIQRILNIYKAPKDQDFGKDDVLSTVRG